MEIVGLGSQVMDCARVRKLIDQHGETFLKQVYTDREVQFCNARKQTTEQFTALWAAKEAVFRAVYSEFNARIQTEALKLGPVAYMTRGEAAASAASNASQIDRAWNVWKAQAEAAR